MCPFMHECCTQAKTLTSFNDFFYLHSTQSN